MDSQGHAECRCTVHVSSQLESRVLGGQVICDISLERTFGTLSGSPQGLVPQSCNRKAQDRYFVLQHWFPGSSDTGLSESNILCSVKFGLAICSEPNRPDQTDFGIQSRRPCSQLTKLQPSFWLTLRCSQLFSTSQFLSPVNTVCSSC